tara:strand:+ start:2294 stop:2998 length:705 start_codon:yes stop_codon:yes gene_type:complete
MSKYEYNRIVDEDSKLTDHRKFTSPVHNPEQPNGDAYKTGKFTRYFVISEIDNRVVEIDEKQYSDVINPKKGISPHFWKPISIFWKLKGPRFDEYNGNTLVRRGVIDVNRRAVEKISKHNPKFTAGIVDLALFATIDAKVQMNLTATPGLLVYTNDINIPFEGMYHIHPTKGPMEGAIHQSKPHELLTFRSEIQARTEDSGKPKIDEPSMGYESPAGGGDTYGGSSGGSGGGGY